MNFIEPWLPSLAIFLGFLVLRFIFRSVIFKFLKIFASKLPFNTNEDIVDAANHPLQFLILMLGLYLRFWPRRFPILLITLSSRSLSVLPS